MFDPFKRLKVHVTLPPLPFLLLVVASRRVAPSLHYPKLLWMHMYVLYVCSCIDFVVGNHWLNDSYNNFACTSLPRLQNIRRRSSFITSALLSFLTTFNLPDWVFLSSFRSISLFELPVQVDRVHQLSSIQSNSVQFYNLVHKRITTRHGRHHLHSNFFCLCYHHYNDIVNNLGVAIAL